MATVTSAVQLEESQIAAKDRIRTGPVPDWVLPCPYPADFKAASPGHVTHLLVNQQIHAESRQTHVQMVMRLETMQGVQSHSPWRLHLEPCHEQIILHSLIIRRGSAEFDQGNLASARFVDRQAAGAASQGRRTLELMLEDVRPGDVLEWSYTVENRPRLLPEYCAAIFALPAGASVGKFHFSVRFHPSRRMAWKSFMPEWHPAETRDQEEVYWEWARENYPGAPVEEHAPAWYVAHPWIQISDCPDWGAVSAAFGEVWPAQEADESVREIARALVDENGGLEHAVEKAVRMVQDEFRCLEADWELDGHPAVPPGTVGRKRYGDGRDLSFFLAHLLNHLGAPARLILVNTNFRGAIADMAPAPNLFNHLLVEYSVNGIVKWADATVKSNAAARNFGLGLPVGDSEACLMRAPAGSIEQNDYELKESILIDTTGSHSMLAVVASARGGMARELSAELERDGLEAMAKKRLRHYTERFSTARLAGPMQYRDDRAAREFHLAEIYEIKGFFTTDPKTHWHKIDLANNFIADFLEAPVEGARHAPLALKHPCHIAHTIELHSVSLPLSVVKQRDVETSYLQFSRARQTMAGYWAMKLSLTTKADAVPAEALEKHRAAVREIREQSRWSLLLPVGEARPRQRGDFGLLPVACNPAPANSSAGAPPPPATAGVLKEPPAAPVAPVPAVVAEPQLPLSPEPPVSEPAPASVSPKPEMEQKPPLLPEPPPVKEIVPVQEAAPIAPPPLPVPVPAIKPELVEAKAEVQPILPKADELPAEVAKPDETAMPRTEKEALPEFKPESTIKTPAAAKIPSIPPLPAKPRPPATPPARAVRRQKRPSRVIQEPMGNPRKGRRRKHSKTVRRYIFHACVFALVMILIVALVAKFADHWQILKARPATPATPESAAQETQ
jgi:hypothetical protein